MKHEKNATRHLKRHHEQNIHKGKPSSQPIAQLHTGQPVVELAVAILGMIAEVVVAAISIQIPALALIRHRKTSIGIECQTIGSVILTHLTDTIFPWPKNQEFLLFACKNTKKKRNRKPSR